MLNNHLLIALRNFDKNRFYTLINVIGLAIGATACLVILLFIRFELSYDKFNVNAGRIFRVDWDLDFGANSSHQAAVTPPMAETLVRDYPEVEAATRFRYMGSFQFKKETENIVEWRVVFADNDLFRIFTIPFIHGNPERALVEPNTMVITEACAEQFFPGESALGKTLIMDNKVLYTITGVAEDLPENSHFHYRMFLSMEGLDEAKNGNWIGGPYNTYLLLRPGTEAKALEAKLPGMVDKYLVPHVSTALGPAFMGEFLKAGNTLRLHLRPLTEIHLHSQLRNELEGNGDILYVYLLGAIAGFILLIACINFVNLSTARSVKRAREVGIRKALGSTNGKLAIQFLTESTLQSFAGFIVALGLAALVLPLFNAIAGLHLEIPGNVPLLLAVIGVSLAVGFLSGLYPSFVLSGYQPARVLKGNASTARKSPSFRSSLVIFQFAISILLMIATMALYFQLNFMQNRKLGFTKEQVIMMRDVKNAGERLFTFRNYVSKKSYVRSATISSYFPGPGSARKTPMVWKFGESPSPDNSTTLEQWSVDFDYVPTLGLEILEGRNFSADFPSDSTAVILNESAVNRMGLMHPIGQRISLARPAPDGSQDLTHIETRTVIGVVKDFNFESLRQRISPLGLFYGTSSMNFMALRYESGQEQELIEALAADWKKIAPGEPFNYTFLDQNFDRLYSTEQKLGRILIVFSFLAVVIACLGLFALTAFTAEQRSKEIGIRKVMGASIGSIVLLLSRQYSKLVLIAFVLAVPLAAYGIHWFLNQYAYKTEISAWLYLSAGITAFLLAFATVAFQSIRSASANPVDALKSE